MTVEIEASAKRKAEPLPRSIYVVMRLEEISRRISELVTEREALTVKLKGRGKEDGTELKDLRQRRAYLVERLAVIRKEQLDLFQERKVVGT
jgi:hypothetical protein